jgi:hypothetical protein
MCMQVDYLFTCGHRCFWHLESCRNFGTGSQTCFGAGGQHRDEPIDQICADCKVRRLDPNPGARKHDPYRKKEKKPSKGKDKEKRRRGE